MRSTIALKQSYNNSKKANKVLVLILVFSIIVSLPSFIPSLFYYFQFYLSSLLLQILSYMFDKNYMFLVCNGLLVLIVKNSGLIGNSPPGIGLNSSDHEHVVKIKSGVGQRKALHVEKRRENEHFVALVEEDKDHEKGEDEIELLSTEELNKKCDEFIKRMKGEI